MGKKKGGKKKWIIFNKRFEAITKGKQENEKGQGRARSVYTSFLHTASLANEEPGDAAWKWEHVTGFWKLVMGFQKRVKSSEKLFPGYENWVEAISETAS